MSREELKQLTVKQLKAKCKELGLKGYSRKSEDELIDLILANATEADATDDLDELLDGPEDEVVEDETVEDEPEDLGPEETDETEDEVIEEVEETESSLVVFRKLIKGAFGFNGHTFKGSTFELSAEDAKHPKILNAIKSGLIEMK